MSTVPCRAKNPDTCRVHGSQLNLTKENNWVEELKESWGVDIKDLTISSVRSAAESVADVHANLEFPNHAAEEHGGYLVLADMADPDKAYNNCDAASSEIVERLHPSDFDADEIRYIGVETVNSEKFHAAVLVIKNGNQYIADYTIRQFNPALPYPYVNTKEKWLEELRSYSSVPWITSQRNMG